MGVKLRLIMWCLVGCSWCLVGWDRFRLGARGAYFTWKRCDIFPSVARGADFAFGRGAHILLGSKGLPSKICIQDSFFSIQDSFILNES